jgi:hypothetical protein
MSIFDLVNIKIYLKSVKGKMLSLCHAAEIGIQSLALWASDIVPTSFLIKIALDLRSFVRAHSQIQQVMVLISVRE